MKTPAAISSRAGPGFTLGLCLMALGLLMPGLAPSGLAAELRPAFIGAKLETAEPRAAYIGAKFENIQVEVIIEGQEPTIIRADRIERDDALDLTLFIGRVSFRRGLETLTADRAVWHNQTRTAEAAGSVRLEAPDFWLEAERAAVNLELSLAKIYQGRAFFSQGHYYLSGTVIERLSESRFKVLEATATTCDGPAPPWTIQAEHLTVTEGGYASATGVVLKGAGSSLPFLATPYFIFPVKTDRQSGLLKPSLALSSKDGLTASLPFFWATGESHDLTYTPVWRENRGLSSTLEGRYHMTWGRGLWQVSHLNDQAERYYDSWQGSSSTRKKAEQRYWLRAQNQAQAGDWDINFNLDLASDPLFLREFTNAPDGFNHSHRLFKSAFGHTLNEAMNPNRANDFYAQKLEGSTQTRAGLHYTQNLNNEGNRDTLQRLPSLQYDLVSRSLDETLASGRLSPRFSFNTRYDHFNRRTNEDSATTETGHRVRLQPTVDWTRPLGLANLRMTGGLEMAAYSADGRRLSEPADKAGRGRAGHDDWYNLLSGSGEVELAATLSRVYEGGPGRAEATRHQVTPALAFKYVEAQESQGRLPYWDHHDRRLPRQTVRYGLTNSLVAKTTTERPAKEEPAVAPEILETDYFQFLKFGLWSSYELEDNSRLTSQPYDRYYDTNYYGQGSGPLEASLEAFFNPHFSTRLISTFNTRTGRPTSHDLSLNLAGSRGDRLTLAYDYDRPEAKYLPAGQAGHQEARADLGIVLNSEWSTNFTTRFDLNDNRALESMAQLNYQAQCYGLSLFYAKTYNEQSVGVVFDLLGLGSLGFGGAGAD